MNKLINGLLLMLSLLASISAQAQEVEMADRLRQDGKIYVVVAVFAVILTGLFVYVFLLDRKIGKLEKEQHHS